MRHYLLTRSAYPAHVPLAQNRARLDLMRAVLTRSLAAQTERDVTWLVLIDREDPLLDERLDVLASSGLRLLLGDAGKLERTSVHDRPSGPWADFIDWSDNILTTRIDDDDAFAPWALEVVHAKALERERERRGRMVWAFGRGYRVTSGRISPHHDPTAPFSSLYAPRGVHRTVMDTNHVVVGRLGRVVQASPRPAWLYIRHPATRSSTAGLVETYRSSLVPVTDDVRSEFPIDWQYVEMMP